MSEKGVNQIKAKVIRFPNGNQARLLRVSVDVDVQEVIAALDLSAPRAVLVLNGGTASLDADVKEQLGRTMVALARVVAEERITVITGGTDAGVFALFGNALETINGPREPCIGVAVTGRTDLSSLEPHHSHFVLVEGETWGDETPVMYSLVAELARNCPSLAIFAGGGPIAVTEMLQNVAQGREMILIAGSKGVTDTMVAACSGVSVSDERAQRIVHEGLVTISNLDQSPAEVPTLIRARLLGDGSNLTTAKRRKK